MHALSVRLACSCISAASGWVVVWPSYCCEPVLCCVASCSPVQLQCLLGIWDAQAVGPQGVVFPVRYTCWKRYRVQFWGMLWPGTLTPPRNQSMLVCWALSCSLDTSCLAGALLSWVLGAFQASQPDRHALGLRFIREGMGTNTHHRREVWIGRGLCAVQPGAAGTCQQVNGW